MASTINASTSGAGGLITTADNSGVLELQSAGVTKATVDGNGLSIAGISTYIYPLVLGTSVTASGTSVDFTGIPSWVKRITVMFSGVSTNGTSIVQVQLGAGSIDASNYFGAGGSYNQANATGVLANSTGFLIGNFALAAGTIFGSLSLNLLGSNLWTSSGVFGLGSFTNILHSAGGKTLSGTLDRVRITTVNGTDTFDAGTINILYEG